MTVEENIKAALAKGSLIIGGREVVKAVKAGSTRGIVVSSNAPAGLRQDLEHYSKISGVPLSTYSGTGNQLGTFLGKPFGVSVLAIKAETKK